MTSTSGCFANSESRRSLRLLPPLYLQFSPNRHALTAIFMVPPMQNGPRKRDPSKNKLCCETLEGVHELLDAGLAVGSLVAISGHTGMTSTSGCFANSESRRSLRLLPPLYLQFSPNRHALTAIFMVPPMQNGPRKRDPSKNKLCCETLEGVHELLDAGLAVGSLVLVDDALGDGG